MDDHQHVDVFVDRVRLGAQRSDLEELLHLLDHRPRHPTLRRVLFEAQRSDDAHHLFLRVREIEDEPRQVVLEERLAGRIEKGDVLAVVGAVARRKTEVAGVSGIVHQHALEAERDRLVLLGRVGVGVVDLEPKHSV